MGSRKHPASVKYADIKAATFRVAVDQNSDADFYGAAGIQQALDNLPAEGGSIFIGEGVYVLSSVLVLPRKPVKIVGAGMGATVIDLGSNPITAFNIDRNGVYTFCDFDIESDGVSGQVAFDASASSPTISIQRVRATVWRVIEAGPDGSPQATMVDCEFPPSSGAGGALWNGQGVGDLLRVSSTGASDYGGFLDGGNGGPSIRAISCDLALGHGGVVAAMRAYGCTFGRGPVETSNRSEFVGCDFIGGSPARWIRLLPGADRSRVVGCAFSGHTSEAVLLDGVSYCVVDGNEGCRAVEASGADWNYYNNNSGFDGSTIIGPDSVVTNWNVYAVSGATTLDETYRTVLADALAGGFTIDLPAAATCLHRKYTIKKIDASANPVVIDPSGAETIDGQATRSLSLQYESITIQSDGSGWHVLSDTSDASSPDVTGEPMGFPVSDDTYTTFSWNNGTNTLTISPVGASFDVWVRGVKYTKSAPQSVTIVPAEGVWFFYFDATGTLVGTQVPWNFSQAAPAVLGYYDATLGDFIFLADERHGLTMDWATHQYLHLTRGCSVDPTGFPISGNLAGDGSADSHAQVGLGTGTGYDEDLAIPVTDGALGVRFRQPLSLPAQIPVYYRDGAANWRRKTSNTFPLLENPPNRIRYNLNTAGVWSQPNASANGNFVAVWICLTNNYREPIVAILGQRQDATLANAQNNNTFEGLDLTGFPSAELKVLWRVIYQTATTYGNTPKARLRDFLDYRSVSPLPATTPSALVHNALSGRNTYPTHPYASIQDKPVLLVANEAQLDAAVAELNTTGGGTIILTGNVTLTGNKSYDLTNISIRGTPPGHYAGVPPVRIDFNGFTITLTGRGCFFETVVLRGTLATPAGNNSQTLFQAAEGTTGETGRVYYFRDCQFVNCIGSLSGGAVVDLSGLNGGTYQKDPTVRFDSCTLHTDSMFPGAPLYGLVVDAGVVGANGIRFLYVFASECLEGYWSSRSAFGVRIAGGGYTGAWLWVDGTVEVCERTGLTGVVSINGILVPQFVPTGNRAVGQDDMGGVIILSDNANPQTLTMPGVGTLYSCDIGAWFEALKASTAQTLTLAIPAGVTVYWKGTAYTNTTLAFTGSYRRFRFVMTSLDVWHMDTDQDGEVTPITAVNADTTLDFSHGTVKVDTSGGARTIGLPAAATCAGRIYRIKKTTADANAVTLDPNGAELIDGAATFSFSDYLRSITIQSDGTGWVIL